MIFGECPYDDCNEPMMNGICNDPPKFQKITCDKCGRIIWLYHSRIDPVAYTEKGFHDEYIVDEANKHITKREASHA